MANISNKEFIKYRKGLATETEKESVWKSEESSQMLWKQWENSDELSNNFEAPDIESMLKSVHKRMRKPLLTMPVLKRIAAILLLPLAAGLTWYLLSQSPEMLSIKTANAEMQEFKLPDNSYVWLNSASELNYPKEFSSSIREVNLNGEALFDIQHQAHQPFIVNIGELKIKVLGTKFNCSAYNDDDKIRVSLLEGKVEVQYNEIIQALMPNEEIVLDKTNANINIQSFNADNVTAWVDGRLIFHNAGFNEIARRLSRRYDYTLSIAEGLEEHRFTLTLKNESITEALELLKLTAPIDYAINQKHVKIMKETDHAP